MLRSTVIVWFLGLKNMLSGLFFNGGFISFPYGQKTGFSGCEVKIKSSFNQQGIWLYSCVLVPEKIRLKSILPENIKFIAFKEVLLPV